MRAPSHSRASLTGLNRHERVVGLWRPLKQKNLGRRDSATSQLPGCAKLLSYLWRDSTSFLRPRQWVKYHSQAMQYTSLRTPGQVHRCGFTTFLRSSRHQREFSSALLEHPDNQYHHDYTTSRSSEAIEINRLLSQALVENESSLVIAALERSVASHTALELLPRTTFARILDTIDLTNENAPMRPLYANRIARGYHHLFWHTRESHANILKLRALVTRAWSNRFAGRIQPSLAEYTALLRFCRGAYDGHTAMKILDTMALNGVIADLDCYKYAFEAVCWADAWHPDERHLLRNTPNNLEVRSLRRKTNAKGNVTLRPHTIGKSGTISKVTEHFDRMLHGGISPDCEAYGHLIIALARDGDVAGMSEVLHRTWGISLDQVKSADQGSANTLVMPKSSSLYPTEFLVFAVAHAFAINNDLSTALELVGFLANKYNIHISHHVWNELLERAYELGLRAGASRVASGNAVGHVSQKTVHDIWSICSSAPYCVKPTLSMHDLMARSYLRGMPRRERNLFPMLNHVLSIATTMLSDRAAYNLVRKGRSKRENGAQLQTLQSQYHISTQLTTTWFEKLLKRSFFTGDSEWSAVWQRQIIPNLIEVFVPLLCTEKRQIAYATSCGYLEIRDIVD